MTCRVVLMLGKASQHLCSRAETGQTHAKTGGAIQEQRPVWDIKVWYVHSWNPLAY